jgi:mono/diheme cytochrome c family protein
MPSQPSPGTVVRRNLAIVAAVVVGIGAVVWWFMPGATSTVVDVEVPELSPVAQAGREAFRANCAQCHGDNAGGTDKGPPLIHKWYHPNHHADAAFFLAAKRGVPQHHWKFGSMPPQPQVGERSIQQITEFVRELQRANGIY